jgi:hypothetical protein
MAPLRDIYEYDLKELCEKGCLRVIAARPSSTAVITHDGNRLWAHRAMPNPPSRGTREDPVFTTDPLTFLIYKNGKHSEEGEQAEIAETMEDAVRLFKEGWPAFRAAHPGNTLLWRKPPELCRCVGPFGEGERWIAYARLVFTELPEALLNPEPAK